VNMAWAPAGSDSMDSKTSKPAANFIADLSRSEKR
jgi:hypothetical protein